MVISIVNEKGGVGKTTTAWALTSGLQRKGFKTLCIDLDTQGNLTHIMGVNEERTIMDVLMGKLSLQEAIQTTPHGDVVAYSPALARLESLLGSGKERRLSEVLQSHHDTIILDLPPGLSLITIMALTASHEAIIPITADILSIKGLSQLYQIIEGVKQNSNPRLNIMGLLLTRYNSRPILRREMAAVLEETAARIGTKVFKTRIREGIAIGEAQARQKDIFDYAPKKKVTQDYGLFVEEVLDERI